jgi:hypothetical protein
MSSREKILARRAKFIAAAIASAGAISCSDNTTAQVCLEPAVDASNADTRPMPCLDPAVDTGVAKDTSVTDTSTSSDTGSATDTAPNTDTGGEDPDAAPMPCLKMPPPADGG